MRFWDSSALVPLLVREPSTDAVRTLYLGDPEVVVWWSTPVECAAAIARLEREGALTAVAAAECFQRLDSLSRGWAEVSPADEVRDTARRLLRVHSLRLGDSLQLAAAWVAAERRPSTLEFITRDERLREAAAREGFATMDA